MNPFIFYLLYFKTYSNVLRVLREFKLLHKFAKNIFFIVFSHDKYTNLCLLKYRFVYFIVGLFKMDQSKSHSSDCCNGSLC